MSARKTKTQPVCPAWCDLAQEHEAQAHDRLGSWYHHERALDVGGFAILRVITIQYFEEQVEVSERQAARGLVPAYYVEMNEDELTQEQMLGLAEGLTRLVKEVTAKVS